VNCNVFAGRGSCHNVDGYGVIRVVVAESLGDCGNSLNSDNKVYLINLLFL
jgi:hypothetical protein